MCNGKTHFLLTADDYFAKLMVINANISGQSTFLVVCMYGLSKLPAMGA